MVSTDEEADPKRLGNVFKCMDASRHHSKSSGRFLVPSSRFWHKSFWVNVKLLFLKSHSRKANIFLRVISQVAPLKIRSL